LTPKDGTTVEEWPLTKGGWREAAASIATQRPALFEAQSAEQAREREIVRQRSKLAREAGLSQTPKYENHGTEGMKS
jgi:hypothetical protein